MILLTLTSDAISIKIYVASDCVMICLIYLSFSTVANHYCFFSALAVLNKNSALVAFNQGITTEIPWFNIPPRDDHTVHERDAWTVSDHAATAHLL